MKKIFIVVVLTCLLSACLSGQNRPYPTYNIPRSVDKIINGLEGCTKEFAFEVMGLPTSEKTTDGKKYFEWNIRKGSCVINAEINDNGIIENIYYSDTRNQCKHVYVRIVRYYRTNPAQNEQTCPNRTDLQGNHRNK